MKAVGTVVLALAVLGAATAQAAMIDLRGAGGNGGGFGNSLQFSSGGIGVTVTAYAETGDEYPEESNYFLFEEAEVYSWATGIGVCNASEGTAAHGCGNVEHEVDTVGFDDLVVFRFDRIVDFQFLTVDPYESSGEDPNDRDIIYWVGTVAGPLDLGTQTFFTLSSMAGFGPEVQRSANSGYSPFTHALGGTGNVLLLAGDYHDLNCKNQNVSGDIECEAYKLANITVSAASVVPLPGAVWLLLSGVVGLVAMRRAGAGAATPPPARP